VIGPDLQAMILPVVLAILIVTLTAVLAKLFLGRQSRGRRILLLGLSDSGKTLMFSRLHSGANIMSQTSMKENRGSFTLDDEKKKVFGELVDVPGHDRLRSQILEKNKQGVRGIILVVDSVSFPQESRDVAELVYDTLADSTFTSHRVPLLLACNKQDMLTAKSVSVIKSQLEKEITALRVTRSAALEGIDNTGVGSGNIYIGKQGKDFEFSHVTNNVSLAECSCKQNTRDKDSLEAVQDWIKGLF
jgi:signal recognition particle receptor subunit beta